MFRRAPCRGSRGHRAAVDFVKCFGVDFFVFFFSIFFFFERIRPAASINPPCLIYLSTNNEARPRERSDRGCFLPIGKKSLFIMRPFVAFRQKSLFITGCVQGAIISLVCLCVSVCVTFVVFTDCKSCTRPISTNAGSMEACLLYTSPSPRD